MKRAALLLLCAGACTGRPQPSADDAAPLADVDDFSCADVREPFGDGPLWLQVKPGAAACIVADPTGAMLEELDRKAELVFAPADYFLPLDEGTTPVDAVVCGDGPSASFTTTPALSTWTIVKRVVLGRERTEGTLATAVVYQDGLEWTHRLVVDGYTDDLADGLLLDDRAWPAGATTTVTRSLVRDDEVRALASCVTTSQANERHTLEHARGLLLVDLAVGADVDVVSARGTLDGQAFGAPGYWNTVARIGDDLYTRDVLIALSPAIGDACALLVMRMAPWSGPTTVEQAVVIDCDGRQQNVDVSSHEYEYVPPPAP